MRIARAGDHAAKSVSGFITTLKDDYVADKPDGSLVLQMKDRTVELLPAACDPRVWLVQEPLGLVVATCAGDEQERGLFILGEGVREQVAASGEVSKELQLSMRSSDIVRSRYGKAGLVWVDFEERRVTDWETVSVAIQASYAEDRGPKTRDGRKLVAARSDDCSEIGPLHWAPAGRR